MKAMGKMHGIAEAEAANNMTMEDFSEMIASMRHSANRATRPLPDESLRSHTCRRGSLGLDQRRRRFMRRNTSMESEAGAECQKQSTMGQSSMGQSGISYSIYSAADYYGKDDADSDSEVSFERNQILEKNISKRFLLYALFEMLYQQLSGVVFAVMGAIKRLCSCMCKKIVNVNDNEHGVGEFVDGGACKLQPDTNANMTPQMATMAAAGAAQGVGSK